MLPIGHHTLLGHIMLKEDKNMLDKEMQRLHYLSILKEDFSADSGPVMLITRNITKDS